jgi:beta-lactamase regulating signal transducer with metallopeptidase domain
MIAEALPTFGFVDTWLGAMVRASLEGAVAIALVWIVCRSVPRLSPGVRCWLWRLALLKMVLAAVPLGSLDLPVLPRGWTAGSTTPATVVADTDEVTSEAASELASSDEPGGTGKDVRWVECSEPHQDSANSGASFGWWGSLRATHPTRTTHGFLVVLFAVWAAVVTAFAAVIFVRIRSARHWRRDWRLIKDRDVLTLNERLAAELGLFQPPILFEAENCESPAVFGAVRTAVVLPSQLVTQSSPGQLRLILAHEMAHIRRWDLLGNWFSTFVSGAFFFHPLVWLALREARLSQEVACDELAVRQPDVSVADYGRMLVELAARCPASAPAVAAVGIAESFHIFLKRRLSAMRTFGTSSRRVFVLSWCVAAVAVLGLLPWRLVAQTEEEEQKEEKAAAQKKATSEATSGQYKIVVDRVRREDNRRITMAPSGFPPFAGKGSQHTETKTFPGGQATTSTAAMGGASGGVFRIPNLILDVTVKEKRTDKRHQLVCTPIGKCKAIDDQGREADSEDSAGWLRLELEGVEYRRGPGQTALHLALADGDPPAKYLKSVDGELLVAEATVGKVAFQAKDLSRPTKKNANGVAVRLEKVTKSAEGVDVKLEVGPPPGAHANADPMANPMAGFQRMMLANAPGRVSVVLEDSEGEMHAASKQSQQGGGSSGGSSVSHSSGSWGGGGGGAGGGSWGAGGPHGKRSGTFSSGDSTPGQTFHFEALPEGVTIKAIHCKVTDFAGTPKAVPYHFENIQIP